MKLYRTHPGEVETLEDLFTRMKMEADPHAAASSQLIIDLIQYLEQNNIGIDKGISTAHQQLVFKPDPKSTGPSVVVSAWAGSYRIEYELPPAEAPWPYARVVGETRDVAEAGQMVAIAFQHAFKVR